MAAEGKVQDAAETQGLSEHIVPRVDRFSCGKLTLCENYFTQGAFHECVTISFSVPFSFSEAFAARLVSKTGEDHLRIEKNENGYLGYSTQEGADRTMIPFKHQVSFPIYFNLDNSLLCFVSKEKALVRRGIVRVKDSNETFAIMALAFQDGTLIAGLWNPSREPIIEQFNNIYPVGGEHLLILSNPEVLNVLQAAWETMLQIEPTDESKPRTDPKLSPVESLAASLSEKSTENINVISESEEKQEVSEVREIVLDLEELLSDEDEVSSHKNEKAKEPMKSDVKQIDELKKIPERKSERIQSKLKKKPIRKEVMSAEEKLGKRKKNRKGPNKNPGRPKKKAPVVNTGMKRSLRSSSNVNANEGPQNRDTVQKNNDLKSAKAAKTDKALSPSKALRKKANAPAGSSIADAQTEIPKAEPDIFMNDTFKKALENAFQETILKMTSNKTQHELQNTESGKKKEPSARGKEKESADHGVSTPLYPSVPNIHIHLQRSPVESESSSSSSESPLPVRFCGNCGQALLLGVQHVCPPSSHHHHHSHGHQHHHHHSHHKQ